MPSEEEVRSLVERIVDGVVDTDNEAPEVSASQSNPSESSTDLLGKIAALCYDVSSARNSREHNHSNVLTLGAGLIGDGLAWQIVEEWLSTEWSGGRHARRVAMIDALDQQYSGPE